MINGNCIFLTYIDSSDLKLILNWRNNPYLRQYFREIKEINFTEQTKWFEKISQKDTKEEVFFAIREKKSGEMVGVCGLNYINWIDRNCQLSLYVGKDDLYIDKYGWAEEALILIEIYAFKTLNLNKIFCEVYEFDDKKFKLLTESNYSKEGELRKHIFKNGKYFNSFILSKIKE